jgi:hypothetical protein
MSIKPVIYRIEPFDVAQDASIGFFYSGATPAANKLMIWTNDEDMDIVYEQKITSAQSAHLLSPAAMALMQNGGYYLARISLYENAEDETPFAVSDRQAFYCFGTPEFAFSNLEADQSLTSTMYTFLLDYAQAEGEPLNVYQFSLYSSGGDLLKRSQLLYGSSSGLGISYYGLETGSEYYIQATGETKNGIALDTGKIRFYVRTVSGVYTQMALANDSENGTVRIQSNLVGISGVANHENVAYIDETMVDLSAQGAIVYFDEGFRIFNNFTLCIWYTALWRALRRQIKKPAEHEPDRDRLPRERTFPGPDRRESRIYADGGQQPQIYGPKRLFYAA